jgi:hypothetical protein
MASKTDSKNEKKARKDKSVPINLRTYEILEDAANKHGRAKIDIASEAIITYVTEKLGFVIPASPEEVLDARLDYLERFVARERWKKIVESKKSPDLAPTLASMVRELQLEPPIVDMEKANAWLKEHGKGEAKAKSFKLSSVKTAAYALKFGLLDKNDDE